MKRIIAALAVFTLLFCACKKEDKNSTTNNGGNNPTTTDPTTYEQYITCKIDGTTYTAYYTAGHTTYLNCVYNGTSQTVFETNADQVTSGAQTLLSDMSVTLYGFQAKQAGTYTCPADLYLDGTLERVVNGSKERITYVISHGESLTVSSYKNGIIEGTFAVEVQDENNSSKLYQVTDGKFKMKVQ